MKDNIGRMYLFQFFFGLYFLGGVIVPFFTDWSGLSFREITLLQAWFVFWMFALEVPTGAVADYFGRKASIIVGCIAFIFGIIIYGITPNFGFFMAGEFLWALSRALVSGADGAIVYDTLLEGNRADDSKKVFGRFRSFFLVGMAVGSPIGSIIAHYIGLREVMLFMILPACCALLVALTFREPKRSHKKISDSKIFCKWKSIRIYRRV
jgi:MFS family permease